MIRQVVRSLVPLQFRRAVGARLEKLRLYHEFLLDAQRYSGLRTSEDWLLAASTSERHRECQMTRDYHQVEKALSLSAPRRPFGADLGQRLDRLVEVSRPPKGVNYAQFTQEARGALHDWNYSGIHSDLLSPQLVETAATPEISEKQLVAFFTSRHSVRDFDGVRPPVKSLDKAVEMAGRTPSVCNRQTWRVHFYYGEEAQLVLALQNGNKGFGDRVPCVAVVTVDARLFCGSGERNQRWVDGGLFAMSLVWALHGLGIATCMLNWSRSETDSARLRRVAAIEAPWDIVSLIALGYPREGLHVARSPRRTLRDISMHHGA